MTELLKVKIAKPTGEVKRSEAEAKRLKQDNTEYQLMDWEVLGIPFGGPIEGRDSDGECFNEDTDIGVSIGQKRPVTYYHGFGPDDRWESQPIPAILGEATYTRADERGHWFDIELDMSEPLTLRLLGDVSNLRASSGAVSHLVRMGEAGVISNWTLGELALFDINDWRLPANDFAVIEAKTKTNTESVAKDGKSDPLVEGNELATKTKTLENPMEKNNMESEEKDKAEKKPIVDTTAEDVKALKADVAAAKAELEALKKAAPGEVKTSPYTEPATVKTVKSKDEQMYDFYEAVKGRMSGRVKDDDIGMTTSTHSMFTLPRCTYDEIHTEARRRSIIEKLGITRVDYPTYLTSGTLNAFTAVDEGDAVPQDKLSAGAKVDFDLTKYAKFVEWTWELEWRSGHEIAEAVKREAVPALAKAYNTMWYNLANASTNKIADFYMTAAYTNGDIEKMLGDDALGEYLDEAYNPAFVTSRSNYWKLKALGMVGTRTYGEVRANDLRDIEPYNLLGYRTVFHNSVESPATGEKSVFLGAWEEAFGLRIQPDMQLLLDPYSAAATGRVRLWMYTMVSMKVINPEAFGYGLHPDTDPVVEGANGVTRTRTMGGAG